MVNIYISRKHALQGQQVGKRKPGVKAQDTSLLSVLKPSHKRSRNWPQLRELHIAIHFNGSWNCLFKSVSGVDRP